jgi:predicted DNA binding CopG/RHH family protein
MNNTYNPENTPLDEDEQWYEDHFDEFTSTTPEIRQSLANAAAKSPQVISIKKQMVSIRLDPQDIQIIKEKAARAGMAYQTMVAALLHQYAVGDLVNIEDARKILKVS